MSHALPRSPELMNADDTGLLVIDVQEKLVPLVIEPRRLVWNIRRLIDGAETLGVAIAATEQYPKGLGATVPELAARLNDKHEKLTFSCGSAGALFDAWRQKGLHRVLVVGMEAHVCVLQTVLDLLASGWRVYLAVDAISARGERDYELALRRMESAGATLTTTEAALFEWCQIAGTPQFKQISKLVQEKLPE